MWTFYMYLIIGHAELKQPNIQNSNGDIYTGYSWSAECGIV